MTIDSLVSSKLTIHNLICTDVIPFLHSITTVFEVLKMAYMSIKKDNLPIFGIAKAKQLGDFATSERDLARGITRMPLVLARIYEEDIDFDAGT